MPPAKLYHVQPFPGLFSGFFCFFCNWKWNLGTGKLENSNRQTKQQLVNMPGAVIEEWWEQRQKNPQRENELDRPSFEGFHTQLDCKFTDGNKNQTQLTLM